MKDLILVCLLLAMLLFGYFIMRKVDSLVEENRRLIEAENRSGGCQIRIAAETPGMLDSAAAALQLCADANPHMEFFFSSGSPERLRQKLLDGSVDLALLSEAQAQALDGVCAWVRIPRQKERVVTGLGLTVEHPDGGNWVCVVWNKARESKDRDRVLFELENECGRMEAGSRAGSGGTPFFPVDKMPFL